MTFRCAKSFLSSVGLSRQVSPMTNNTVDNRWLLKQDLDRECLDVERRRLMSGVEHNETIMVQSGVGGMAR